jgi:hypothetical protein
MLEQRHDVGERFVERVYVGIARLVEAWVDAVEKGVRHLVRDDVVRQAGENRRAGCVVRILCLNGKIAEQHGHFLRTIVCVLVTESVRIDA